MQNSQAYIEFKKQINATGREKMDGYAPQTLANIYDWERKEVEDTIWHKFVKENDSDLAIFMPELTKYNGIDALKAKLNKFIIPSGARFNVAEALYIATNELLNVTPSQAYRLLKKMSDKGRIKLVGNGRSAYYELI